MGKNKRQNRQRDVIPIEEYQKQKEQELSYTKQQIFNFDTNILEDEKEKKEKLFRRRNEIIDLKKQVLKLEKETKDYKSVIILLSLISFALFSVIGIFIYLHTKYEPKYIEKEKIVQDENIVFLGDSITWMYDLAKYYPNRKVINSGVDGEFTDGVLENMDSRVYKYNPSKVFILIGTNDIYKGKTIDEITENVDKIVKNIKKNRPYCQIYLESLYPINATNNEKIHMDMVKNRTNKFIKQINKKYKIIAKENNITYIDMYSKLLDDNGNLNIDYTKEGLHLVDEGYDVVTKEINKYLKD